MDDFFVCSEQMTLAQMRQALDLCEEMIKKKELEPLKKAVDLTADRYYDDVVEKSHFGGCEGACDSHYGVIKTLRVFDKLRPYDWGWFSYCEQAVKEDTHKGFVLLTHEDYVKYLK